MSDLVEITDEERAQLEHAAELLGGALSSPTGRINSTAMLAYDTLRSLANRKPAEPRATDPRVIMLSDKPRPFKADSQRPVGDGERATGLRRGHLADLEVIEAILRSDPREEASEYAANPKSMADAVRNMIEDPDLHNPESPGPIVFEADPAPQEAE